MRDEQDMRAFAEHGRAWSDWAGRGLAAALGLMRRRVRHAGQSARAR